MIRVNSETEKHLSEFRVVDKVWSVSVDEGTQSKAILPAEIERTKQTHREQERENRGKSENLLFNVTEKSQFYATQLQCKSTCS